MTNFPIPPATLRAGLGPFEDPEVFLQSGRETMDLARRLIGLQPADRVLDIGCGCGRIAVHLAEFLAPDGSYAGFDIDAECIEWCQSNIEGRDTRFHFTHLDVWSASYNPAGTLRPDRVTLPYPRASFDRVLISSVFTHMTEDGIHRYLAEVSRVVKPRGTVLVSALLMNEDAVAAIEHDTTLFTFVDSLGEYSWTLDVRQPLDGVAVAETWLLDTAARHGLVADAVSYGTWRDVRGWEVQHDWLGLRRLQGTAA